MWVNAQTKSIFDTTFFISNKLLVKKSIIWIYASTTPKIFNVRYRTDGSKWIKNNQRYIAMIEKATHFFNKLSHTIVALYALTLSIVTIGTAFALHQNWSIRIEATQVNPINKKESPLLLKNKQILFKNDDFKKYCNQRKKGFKLK